MEDVDDVFTGVYRRMARAIGAPVIGGGGDLEVRASALGPAVGLGLFAARPFRRGELVTTMEGTVRNGWPRDPREYSHACTLLHRTLWLDGLRQPVSGCFHADFRVL